MFYILSRLSGFLTVVFLAPAFLNLAIWSFADKPSNWREADWSSAKVLPANPLRQSEAVYVLSARTGGLKGALATHSWIVIKQAGRRDYDRYDVVGWGTPVRKNAYAADGRWYSNKPMIAMTISGPKARPVIAKVEAAIADYRWRKRGDYTLWPGPNSNTFVAAVVRDVPELAAVVPSTAVGRDFPTGDQWFGTRSDGALFASLGGYAGIVVGRKAGLEINFLGLVAGIDPINLAIKVPTFGTFRLS